MTAVSLKYCTSHKHASEEVKTWFLAYFPKSRRIMWMRFEQHRTSSRWSRLAFTFDVLRYLPFGWWKT